MSSAKEVIVGSIDDYNGTRLFTTVKLKRHKVIYELNNWFFDYFRETKVPIEQLPPLDDWVKKNNNWYILFTDQCFNVRLDVFNDLE
jgi:hypothetical protein